MATTPQGVSVLTQDDKKRAVETAPNTEQKPNRNGQLPPLSFTTLPPVMAKKVGTFLKDNDLAQLRKTMRFSNQTYASDMAERKRVREEILPHVFNANPQGIDAFFKSCADAAASHSKLLLTKASYREGYDSKTLGKFVSFRHKFEKQV